MTAIQDVGYLLERTDIVRQSLSKKLAKKEKLRQYFSSLPIANLMASMMDYPQKKHQNIGSGSRRGLSLYRMRPVHMQ